MSDLLNVKPTNSNITKHRDPPSVNRRSIDQALSQQKQYLSVSFSMNHTSPRFRCTRLPPPFRCLWHSSSLVGTPPSCFCFKKNNLWHLSFFSFSFFFFYFFFTMRAWGYTIESDEHVRYQKWVDNHLQRWRIQWLYQSRRHGSDKIWLMVVEGPSTPIRPWSPWDLLENTHTHTHNQEPNHDEDRQINHIYISKARTIISSLLTNVSKTEVDDPWAAIGLSGFSHPDLLTIHRGRGRLSTTAVKSRELSRSIWAGWGGWHIGSRMKAHENLLSLKSESLTNHTLTFSQDPTIIIG